MVLTFTRYAPDSTTQMLTLESFDIFHLECLYIQVLIIPN